MIALLAGRTWILYAGVAAAGLAAGWTLNGWRLSGQIHALQGVVSTQAQAIATLEGANQRCTAGVAEVSAAVKAYVAAGAARAREAAEAMQRAERGAQAHLAAARGALERPAPKAGEECDTAAAEAADYARRRKAAP